MIITISGANFSASNIGTLSTWTVSKSIGAGAEHSIPSYVDKNSAFNYTITLKDGYTFGTYSVTMGGQTITPTVTETSMTINIASVTGAIRIEVKTINSSTGEEDKPVTPEQPGTGGGGVTPTMYTFTINPTPTTATVTLTASGYSQSGNSISVASGTSVSWEVSASGYDTIKGTRNITENKTLDVEITDLTNAEKIDTTEANVVIGKWITVEKGKERDLTAWRTTNFVEIPSGATHVYSNDITLYRLSGNNTTPYGFYDNEKNYVSGIPLDVYPVGVQVPPGAAGKWRGVLKWPIPEGVKYVRVCWTYPGSGYVHELTGKKTVTVASPDVYFLKNN